MGFFDVHCAESGLPLRGGTILVVIAREGERWVPVSLPVEGIYDRLGAIDSPALDRSTGRLFEQIEVDGPTKHPDSEEEILRALWQAPGRWNGRDAAYCLFDAGIFLAGALAVARGGRHEALTPETASRRRWADLIASTFVLRESRSVYASREPIYPQRRQLIALARFLAAGAPLKPAFEQEVGQYSTGSSRLQPIFEAARRRYSDSPEHTRAVERAAAAWGLPTAAESRTDEEDPDEAFEDPDQFAASPIAADDGGVPLRWLVVGRSFDGSQTIELSVDDLARVALAVRKRLLEGRGEIVLVGEHSSVQLLPGDEAGFRIERGALTIRVTTVVAEDLSVALDRLGAGEVRAELPSLPGVILRV